MVTYEIKVFYLDGKQEIIQVVKPEDKFGKLYLINGCIYKYEVHPLTMFEDIKYADAVRCGVKYYKTINITKK